MDQGARVALKYVLQRSNLRTVLTDLSKNALRRRLQADGFQHSSPRFPLPERCLHAQLLSPTWSLVASHLHRQMLIPGTGISSPSHECIQSFRISEVPYGTPSLWVSTSLQNTRTWHLTRKMRSNNLQQSKSHQTTESAKVGT
jgi:hypothetical protein